ncbi:MAG: recombinase RecA [Candidatus Krumholzibacteriota bacterium]|nr:recombinase RecA [Candidatus Krumholzibacteriota bacterium]
MTREADQNGKRKALDLAFSQIEKQFGKGSIMRLGDNPVLPSIDRISTGSLALDAALGIGGIPRGRVVEIYGPEGSGKTTLALSAVANAQRAGGTAAFVDAEHAMDPVYARKLGVDVDNLLVSQPDTGEQALEITEVLVRSGALDAVVVDSVAALVPAAEIEGEMGDAHMGLQARLMSQALRKLTGVVSKSNTCLIFINQIRMRIGVMFGNPETTTGGNALKFYSSVRMDIRRIQAIKRGEDVIGSRCKVKVVKNKVAPPFKVAEFDLYFGDGICYESDLVELGVKAGIVDKSGTWFSYGDIRMGQGKENTRQFLKQNPDIRDELDGKLRIHLGLTDAPAGAGAAAGAGISAPAVAEAPEADGAETESATVREAPARGGRARRAGGRKD